MNASPTTVLSMRGKDAAVAVAQLMAGTRNLSFEEEASRDENKLHFWDSWPIDGIEGQGTKLMNEDIGAATQSLQVKALRTMPISVATAIHHYYHQSEALKVDLVHNVLPS